MTSIEQVAAMCRSTGLTVAADYYEPDSADKGPHIVFRHEGTRSLKAAGAVYATVDQWSVSLYTARHDPVSESLVEAALAAFGVPAGDSMSGYDDERRVHWAEWDFETTR